MRNFDDRLQRDLEHIADSATPSPTTAWDAIQSRIAEQADQPQMEITMLQPDPRNDRRLNARMLVAAAAMFVLVAGLSVLLFSSGDSNSLDVTDTDTTVPVTSTTSVPSTTEVPAAPAIAGDDAAVQIALEFVDARSIYDGERASSLFAPDAEIFGDWIESADDYPLLAEFDQAIGWTIDDASCSSGSPGRVSCTVNGAGAWTEALGKGPYPTSFLFTIDGGRIQSVTSSALELEAFQEEVYGIVRAWIAATYPESIPTLFNETGEPVVADDTIALWEQYTAEFIADVLVPVAVVDSAAAGELVAHAGPDATSEQVRSILPNSMDLGAVGELDGQEWVQVLTADGRDLNGWVNAASLIAIEGEVEQPRPLFEMASSVRNALLQSTPANRLADRTDELRVSIDGPLDASDPVYQAQDLSTSADVAAVIEEFGATNALLETDRISINAPIRTADAQDSIAALFPEATVVELHYSGDAGDEDATWESVLLILVPDLNVGTTATDIVEDSTEFKIAGLAFFTATP